MKLSRLIIATAILLFTLTACQQKEQHQGTKLPTETGKDAVQSKTTAQATANNAATIYQKQQIPVLCYHRIDAKVKSDYAVSPEAFEAQIKILADSGYHSILPEQLYNYLVYNQSLPEKPVMITFDDSRAEQATIAAPILENHGFRGVFFLMTITYNKQHYMNKDQILNLLQKGHVIGLHSWDHTMVTKYTGIDDWNKEVTVPKKKLEALTGKPVEYWAYPDGVYNHQAAETLSKYFKLSFSLAGKRDSVYPLQTVRRIIVPGITPEALLRTMRHSFTHK